MPPTGRAIVTGASSGLGRSIALMLAKDGYELALVGRNESALNSLVAAAGPQAADRIKIVRADLADPAQYDGLVDRCQMALGGNIPLSLLVNCAGIAVTGRIEDIAARGYQQCWNVNFFAAVALTQQAILVMRENGKGSIVNVSSGVARRALPYYSPYCTAKAALNSFTESLRVELVGSGIKAVLFSPGPVESGFHDATLHFGATRIAGPRLNGRTPDEVATILFRALKSGKERVVIGGRAALGHHLNYWAPALADKVLGRFFKIEKETKETLELAKQKQA